MDRRNFIRVAGGTVLAGGVMGHMPGLAAMSRRPAAVENTLSISGTCDPAFAVVRQTFEDNFRQRDELGAAVCVYKDGQKVVDLWGGIADRETGQLWAADTIVCMMSVGKSMAALSVLMLVDRGVIDLEAPVARYWPEFGQAGKEAITVRTLLTGKAAVLYADQAPDGSAYDWDTLIEALEKQEPAWEPGTRGAYHSMSMGVLLGELVHRADGRMIDVFFAEEVAGPLGADYRFGLTDEDIARVSDIVRNEGSTTLNQIADPTTKLGRAWRVVPNAADRYNRDDFRRAVFPSSNGHGNARAIARIYAALAGGGAVDDVRLVSPETVEIARTESWNGTCGMTGRDFRYGHGFFMHRPPLLPFGVSDRAFGHPGAGGAIGFADPEAGIAFSYSPNFMTDGAGVGDRCNALIDATFSTRT
ncbi:MAG: serine hydrolase domain-containing protein [Sphingomonadales bacterium]